VEIADERAEICAMSRGELEAQVLQGDRAQAIAPPDTSSQLRVTSQAEADARHQAADAEAEHAGLGLAHLVLKDLAWAQVEGQRWLLRLDARPGHRGCARAQAFRKFSKSVLKASW
jgi:hypothetical protein